MRVLILADANSSHTIKWVNSLKEVDGITIGLWSLNVPKSNIYCDCANLKIASAKVSQQRNGFFKKLRYLTSVFHLRKFIKKFKPDIVHAHYASSYGLLGRIAGFRPLLISVWGSDVFAFPKKNRLFKDILRGNLNSANLILSTSHIMKEETRKYTRKEIIVTPFGIDTEIFKPQPKYKHREFVIGTVKTLEKIYGIQYLIHAYKIFKDRNPTANSSLLIVGGGSQFEVLRDLARQLDVYESVTFVGSVSPNEVPRYHNMMDISVFLSLEESFGVAVLEAMATERPVIVSDAVGLKEIVDNGVNGIIVPKMDIESSAFALEKLFWDEELRRKLGYNARRTVQHKYEWKNNVLQMEAIYSSIVQ